MRGLFQDFKYAVRSLSRSPLLAVVAALTLGLGIGVNTAIFSSLNSMMLRPMPAKDARRLVVLALQDNQAQWPHEISYPEYQDFKRLEVFEDATAFQLTVANFHRASVTDRMWLEAISGNYFQMLGLKASQGRLFGQSEKRSPLLVLSYSCWQGRFGGDRAIIGSSVRLNGQTFTISGVAPQSYHGGISYIESEGFVPLKAPGIQMDTDHRDQRSYRFLARLKKGASVRQAQNAASVLAKNLEREYPATERDIHPLVLSETQSRPEPLVSDKVQLMMESGMALVIIVLLIACANIANLLLVRAANRSREIAIRVAVGASGRRLTQLFLNESFVLALFGLVIGMLLSSWVTSLFAAHQPSVDFKFRSGDYTLDVRVLAFTATVTLLTTIVCGILPALQVARWDLNQVMKQAGPFGSKQRLSGYLVVAQVAASLLLLVFAGLFTRALHNARQINLGYELKDREVFSFNLASQGYDDAKSRAFLKRILDRIKSLPQVRDASFVQWNPFSGFTSAQIYRSGEVASKTNPGHSMMSNIIGPGYFRTMGTRLLDGREFTQHDDTTSQPVAVVNQAFADLLWPGKSAMGETFRIGTHGEKRQVVGVVETGKYFQLAETPQPWYFVPFAQSTLTWGNLVVRSQGPPASVMTEVRNEFRALDSELPLYGVMTLEHLVNDGYVFGPFRIGVLIATAFGLVGLAMAAIGVYGVISYSVGLRTREIGIRLGLGANRRDVLALVMRQGLFLISVGIAVGLGGVLAAGGAVPKGTLYGISPRDPLTLAGVIGLLVCIGLLACYIPARRAMRVDPVIALRAE